MIGWRRDNPDCNPDSLGCSRDLGWLENLPHKGYRAKWQWESELYSRGVEGGHECLSVRIKVERPDRLDDAPFSFYAVPFFHEGMLPIEAYIRYPADLPEALQPAFLAHYAPALAAPDPWVRLSALFTLAQHSYLSHMRWEHYGKKHLRGISRVLDGHYKNWRRSEREKLRAARIVIAEKYL